MDSESSVVMFLEKAGCGSGLVRASAGMSVPGVGFLGLCVWPWCGGGDDGV